MTSLISPLGSPASASGTATDAASAVTQLPSSPPPFSQTLVQAQAQQQQTGSQGSAPPASTRSMRHAKPSTGHSAELAAHHHAMPAQPWRVSGNIVSDGDNDPRRASDGNAGKAGDSTLSVGMDATNPASDEATLSATGAVPAQAGVCGLAPNAGAATDGVTGTATGIPSAKDLASAMPPITTDSAKDKPPPLQPALPAALAKASSADAASEPAVRAGEPSEFGMTARVGANAREVPVSAVVLPAQSGLLVNDAQAMTPQHAAANATATALSMPAPQASQAAALALGPSAPSTTTAGASAAAAAAASLSAQVGTPEWDDALSQKVVFLSSAHQQTAELTLNPPDLGPLQVVLQVADSHAHALFVSPHPQVREAVEAALPKLREAMESNGIGLGSASVSNGFAGQAQQQAYQPSPRGASPGAGGTSGRGPAALMDADAPRAGGAVQRRMGIVDTFV
jgi:flagellar hook-length control protein FliK